MKQLIFFKINFKQNILSSKQDFSKVVFWKGKEYNQTFNLKKNIYKAYQIIEIAKHISKARNSTAVHTGTIHFRVSTSSQQPENPKDAKLPASFTSSSCITNKRSPGIWRFLRLLFMSRC